MIGRTRRIISSLSAGFLVAAVLCIAFPAPAFSGYGGYAWTEVSPSPTTMYLYDICAVADDDIWAVGRDGVIVHYDGAAWSAATSPTATTLYGVSAAFEGDIWSVGQWGNVARYSGGTWNALLPSPAPEQLLYDVSALGDASGEAWAVCMSGKIYHYDFSGWSEVLPQPATRQLRGVAAISRDDVWAVGEGYWGEGGLATVLHFDGTSWSQFPSTAYGWMEDISAAAVDDIWACGNDGAGSAALYHYDGSSWSAQRFEGAGDLWGIHARASDDVWAVGSGGTVLHYNGNNWTDLSGVTGMNLMGVVSPAPGVVWLVGEDGLIIRGDAAPPVVTSVVPSSGVNNDSACEVTVTGDDFQDEPTSVKLTGPATAEGTGITYLDSQNLSCTFDLSCMPAGTYGIEVTNPYGGSGQKAEAFTVTNPQPNTTGISPSTRTAGSGAFTLTVNGGSFVLGSVVRWNGSDRTTTYVSPIKLTASIPASDIASAGTASVTVSNPAPGGGTSNARAFTVSAPPEPPPSGQHTWYLAEGTTAWGFSTYISIANPNDSGVSAKVTLMPKGAGNVIETISLPANSQTTLTNDHLSKKLGGQKDFSTKVEATDHTKTIAVDRNVSWTGPGAASPEGHSSVGVTSPAKTWYLPEGSTNWGFETWLLIQNPNNAEASCDVTYMIEGEGPRTVTHKVPANSRATYNMADDIGPADASIKVTSNIPVIPERAMYRYNRREGHDSIGTTTPAEDYYLAEGAVGYGSGYTTYVLVQNPQGSPTDVDITYLTGTGQVPGPSFTMAANSRKTVKVNDTLPPNTDVSTSVHGSKPIIAERAMYWDSPAGEACHDSIGMSTPHCAFYLPDGQTSEGRETWTLVQNPSDEDVQVEVSYLPAGGGNPVRRSETIPANSRKTFNMAEHSGITGRASVIVRVGFGRKVMVERAMYWNNRGAGTDTIGGYSD